MIKLIPDECLNDMIKTIIDCFGAYGFEKFAEEDAWYGFRMTLNVSPPSSERLLMLFVIVNRALLNLAKPIVAGNQIQKRMKRNGYRTYTTNSW